MQADFFLTADYEKVGLLGNSLTCCVLFSQGVSPSWLFFTADPLASWLFFTVDAVCRRVLHCTVVHTYVRRIALLYPVHIYGRGYSTCRLPVIQCLISKEKDCRFVS